MTTGDLNRRWASWTGAPDEREPLGIRASVRHSVWTYKIVDLTGANFTLDDEVQWRKRMGRQAAIHVRVRIDSVIDCDHSWFTLAGEPYKDHRVQQSTNTLARIRAKQEAA